MLGYTLHAEPPWSPPRLCMLPSSNAHTFGIRKNSGNSFLSVAVMTLFHMFSALPFWQAEEYSLCSCFFRKGHEVKTPGIWGCSPVPWRVFTHLHLVFKDSPCTGCIILQIFLPFFFFPPAERGCLRLNLVARLTFQRRQSYIHFY